MRTGGSVIKAENHNIKMEEFYKIK
jgi:hypothetical protein